MKPFAAKSSWGSSRRTEIMTPLKFINILLEFLFLNNSHAFQDFKLIFLENVSLTN